MSMFVNLKDPEPLARSFAQGFLLTLFTIEYF